jgi:TFIIF-interacting CTD phosphatase-like protein
VVSGSSEGLFGLPLMCSPVPLPGSARGTYREPEYILPAQAKKDKGKKTLILDLDETLVHSSFQPVEHVDIVLPVFATNPEP